MALVHTSRSELLSDSSIEWIGRIWIDEGYGLKMGESDVVTVVSDDSVVIEDLDAVWAAAIATHDRNVSKRDSRVYSRRWPVS
jgi:hypothetical protein